MAKEKHYLTENAKLMAEWNWEKNEKSPDQYTLGSEEKVWWKCEKGHEWLARINNRNNGRGCPYCSGSKVLKGYNDLETWCNINGREDLLREWDYDYNSISPSQITAHNRKKVWWKCSLGHKWEATIGSRTSSQRPCGCPYCSNPPKKVLVGFNDFESWCINNGKRYLLQEWNTERNTNISPREITYGSGMKAWWKCNKGHEWCVSVANRVRGTGCPICSRTQTSFPEQAIAYYLSKSFDVLQRYSIKGYEIDVFLEKYNIGIEYDGLFFHTEANSKREKDKDSFYKAQGITLIHIKENKHKNCIENNTVFFVPQKSNYLDESFNDLLKSLIKYLSDLTGIIIDTDVDIIRDELAIREHYASVLKNNSVAAVFPKLVSEWDVEKNNGLTPDHFSANAHTKVWWRCKNGHSWQADISSRNRNLGCPYCAGQRTVTGENDFESWCKVNKPQLLLEWNYAKNNLKPFEIPQKYNKKVWWICLHGHEWEASVANRVNGTNCPFCNNGKNVVTGISLADWCKGNHKEQLLVEWNYEKNGELTPETVTKGSHKKVWWKCTNGHEWEAQIKSRTYNHGCPYCSGTNKRAQVGKNDLKTWCKQNGKQYILDEWDYDSNDGLVPEMFTFGSHKRINWKCKNGHKWSAVIKERTKYKGNMCPECKKNNI